MELFREIMIWKRLDDVSAVRYSCLNDLQNGKFAVQCADFFRLPLDGHAVTEFARQFAALFIEVAPHERCSWFDSLEEAIRDHEHEFS
jgi:hypothetical protein